MKIICIGRNYSEHALELNNPAPQEPVVFMKPPSALLVNNKPFYYPDFSKDIHYECEVVLRIGKNGRHVQPEFADSYISGITLGIDFTARDLQQKCKEKGHPWEIAKGFDQSAVLGKWFQVDEFDSGSIRFTLEKNGEVVQTGDTADMLFSFSDIIVYVSRFFKLQTGDLIYTGTPSGVGPITIGEEFAGFLATHSGNQEAFRFRIR